MKATELRIGNYYLAFGVDLKQVETLTKDKILIDFTPIPLTEEWLFKFGFEDDRDNLMILRKGVFEFSFDKVDKDGISLYEKWDGNFLYNVEYVHEFQNLHFVLTGEELVVKE
jgi:hypothetical protein